MLAIRLTHRTAGAVSPRIASMAWPAFDREFAEDQPVPRRATTTELAIAERAIRWQARYLIWFDEPRAALNLWLRCKLFGRPFRDEIAGRWSKSEAYRLVDRAASLIAMGLNRDGVPVLD